MYPAIKNLFQFDETGSHCRGCKVYLLLAVTKGIVVLAGFESFSRLPSYLLGP